MLAQDTFICLSVHVLGNCWEILEVLTLDVQDLVEVHAAESCQEGSHFTGFSLDP